MIVAALRSLQGWLSQDVARANAARASARLAANRRQLDEIDTLLADQGQEAGAVHAATRSAGH
jgi:hypothetical protein